MRERLKKKTYPIFLKDSPLSFSIDINHLSVEWLICGKSIELLVNSKFSFDDLEGFKNYLIETNEKLKLFFLSNKKNINFDFGSCEFGEFDRYIEFMRDNSGQVTGMLVSKTNDPCIEPSRNCEIEFLVDPSYFYKFEEDLKFFLEQLEKYQGHYFEEVGV